MEKKSKTEKLKLRGINQAILVSSYNSGAGTGPNDCMTEEVYQCLNDQGALDTSVYVWHWIDDQSPFYINRNERDDHETNGGYVMGIVTATSKNHDKIKNWLVTFNHWGKWISCYPIGECIGGIIPEGHFNKVEEIYYQPKNYALNMLFKEHMFIRKGGKKRSIYKDL